MKLFLQWMIIFPSLGWALFFSDIIDNNWIFQVLATILLIFCVMSSVHHSEIIAHRVGEPYGTIILAVAVTVIEVSIIISFMLSGERDSVFLARDTVYSAAMLILNGIIGLCLFIGGIKYHEQNFSKHSASIALVCLVSIIILTLVFPSYTTSIDGPYYSKPQLFFVSAACLVIYCFFIFAQTTRHRNYFLTDNKSDKNPSITVNNFVLILSLVFLLISLGIVVLLAKTLSPTIEKIIVANNLPKALVGIIIAGVILLPEGIAAIIAARNNQLQTSINLALGSALASIALTIPAVAMVCSFLDIKIALGLDIKSIILLALSVFIVMLSLASGRTNLVYGVVLIINLIAFIFLIIYP